MNRFIASWMMLLAWLPAVGYCYQADSNGVPWSGGVDRASRSRCSTQDGGCGQAECNGAGAGGCGETGCSQPPCGGPLYKQKYLSLFGGYADIDNFESKIGNGTSEFITGAKLRDGYAAGFAVGGQMIDYVRSEFEFTYRANDVSSFFEQEFNTSGSLLFSDREPAAGTINSYSGMFNLIVDTCPRCIGSPALYLGGGLGGLYADGSFDAAAERFLVQNSSFAYQFLAGVNYPVSERVELYTEYRYLGADHLNVESETFDVSLGDFGYDSHNVFLGLRFRR
ncbi:MAG: outer membrane protein [Planctomycetota bacterium]|jgi:opacity protein-like surface antigen